MDARTEAEKRIGHLSPKPPARRLAATVTPDLGSYCQLPHPAFGVIAMLLVRSWLREEGQRGLLCPSVVAGKVRFDIGHDQICTPAGGGWHCQLAQPCIVVPWLNLIVSSRQRPRGQMESLMAMVARGN